MATYSPIIQVMMRAAQKAAKGLMRDFGEVEHLQVSQKGPADFVAAADTRTQKILIAELQAGRSTYDIFSRGTVLAENGDEEYFWIIDPIDGIANFTHGFPFFCMSIGLAKRLQNDELEIVAAVIDAPALGETFFAEKGAGAWFERQVESGRMRVSARKQLDKALTMVGGIHVGFPEVPKLLRAICETTAGVRDIGSSALGLAYLAAGRVDIFCQRGQKPWDIAAGMLLVKESGGRVTDWDGGDQCLKNGDIAASAASLHTALLSLINTHTKS